MGVDGVVVVVDEVKSGRSGGGGGGGVFLPEVYRSVITPEEAAHCAEVLQSDLPEVLEEATKVASRAEAIHHHYHHHHYHHHHRHQGHRAAQEEAEGRKGCC